MDNPLMTRVLYRIHDRALDRMAGRYLHGRLIDIGCGEKPYRNLITSYVQAHVGVDRPETLHNRARIDLLGSAYEIPVESLSFDSALCTAVLEHLEEPELALRECHRVLKPGGVAVYSVPFIVYNLYVSIVVPCAGSE